MPSELKDRIAEALAESGKSKAELARYCQVAPASVTAWFNGKTKSLDAVSAIKAAMFLGVNALWLTTGKGEKAAGVGEIYEEESTPDGFVEIPEYEITFGAGDCFTPSYEEVTEIRRALYREDWLKNQASSQRTADASKCTAIAWCQFSLMATEYFATAARVRKSSMGRFTSFVMANPFV